MARRALVTGISGFVGGHLAERLLAAGQEVLGAAPDDGTPLTCAPVVAEIERVRWDFSAGPPDEAACRSVRRFAPQAIYHLAALSVPEDCGAAEPNPLAWAINVEGVRRVLELAAALRSRPRVLLASTCHVYTPASPGNTRFDERSPLGPVGAYGRTKLAAEELVRQAVREGSCEAVIARGFAHTGPRQSPRMMLPQWAAQFAAGGSEPVEVYTRDARIDLSDVRDVVRAYERLVELGQPGEAYNVGSGEERTSGEVLEMLRRQADPDRPIVEIRPGFKQERIADIGRLGALAGWRPEIPIEQTVADTWAWWVEHGG